jgi:hypothetical protein
MSDETIRPLDGVKVLDLTRHMAGPYGTMLLADYGADVIKIESLPGGEPSRTTGTAFVNGESSLFLIWNRGKRSVALDLRSEEGRQVVRRLAKDCDVLVENYKPGVTEQMGLGFDELSAENPGLIYVSVSAFGEGPLAPFPGTDPVVQAMSGVMSVTGEADGGPLLVGVPVADFAGAMVAAQGVMLGLLARVDAVRADVVANDPPRLVLDRPRGSEAVRICTLGGLPVSGLRDSRRLRGRRCVGRRGGMAQVLPSDRPTRTGGRRALSHQSTTRRPACRTHGSPRRGLRVTHHRRVAGVLR